MSRNLPCQPTESNTPPAVLVALARAALGITRDDSLANALGVKFGTISQWRMGRAPIPDHHVIALAEMAGADVGWWLATICADKAKMTDAREAWRAVAERLQSAHG